MATKTKIRQITADEFDSAIATGKVLVVFSANWCAPCRMQEQVLEELVNEVGHEVTVVKVDPDRDRSLAERLDVNVIPTSVVYNNGNALKILVGIQQKETLLQILRTT